MKYLNLTKGFNPTNAVTSDIIEYNLIIFSGGEPHIRIKEHIVKDESVTITLRLNTFVDIGVLLVAVDALKNLGYKKLYLSVPYFPGARQDRICYPGEAFTAKVYADLINNLNLAGISIYDPHSEVISRLLNNCTVVKNHQFIDRAIRMIKRNYDIQTYIICPDAGAKKKFDKLENYLHKEKGHVHGAIECSKVRDPENGKLSGFEVSNDLPINGHPCIIVDDICDGGGTFIGLAEALRKEGAGDLYLVVSHGIFSKGFKELNKYFKNIYITDSIFDRDSLSFNDRQILPTNVKIIKFQEIYGKRHTKISL